MEITANALQIIGEANQNVIFTETAVCGSNSIIHREGSGLTTLKGLTNQCRARFRIFFNGNGYSYRRNCGHNFFSYCVKWRKFGFDHYDGNSSRSRTIPLMWQVLFI